MTGPEPETRHGPIKSLPSWNSGQQRIIELVSFAKG
jgi:hypothetical protein